MIGQHSRDSSYSDLSADGGAGYYDRYARHFRRTDYNIRSYVTNMLTINNFKVIFSGICWWTCYMIMGVFGGSVAYLHFERSDRDIPDPLPDFGYDVIPVSRMHIFFILMINFLCNVWYQRLTDESLWLCTHHFQQYFCPAIPHVPHGNVQSIVLFILYALILAGVVLRWKPKYHPKTGEVIWGGDGRLILQHLFHLNCLVFLSRTTTVGLTGLPQPNPKCVEQQHLPVSFGNAMSFVMGRGLVPHACGDLIYSGHVGCTLMCMAVLTRHGFLRHKAAAIATWLVAAIGIYFTISCRSHYSVDVMLAFYFGYFLPEWYFNRSDKRVSGTISKLIRRLEVRPEDLRPIDYDDLDKKGVMAKHEIDDDYPTTIAV